MGWLKSNVAYEKHDGVPDFDSPMGVLMMLVWRQRQAIEFQKTRALIQGLAVQKDADNEIIKKAFDELKEAFFPFQKNARKSEHKKMEEVMKAWINRGPLGITVLDDPKARKKVAGRLSQGQKELAKHKEQTQAGKTKALDPFQKAQRRTRGAS